MADFIRDLREMHSKFGVEKWVTDTLKADDTEKMHKLLEFRLKSMLTEEYLETIQAFKDGDSEELVDGLIDIVVIALGTLEMMDVDIDKAWNQVMGANLAKEAGVKPERPNPLNLPDLIKPEGWTGPSHKYNHGLIPFIFQEHNLCR